MILTFFFTRFCVQHFTVWGCFLSILSCSFPSQIPHNLLIIWFLRKKSMRHFYFPMELTKCLEWSNRLVQIKVLLGTVLLNSRTASPSQSNGNVTVNAMHVLLFQHGKDWFALSLSLETYTEQISSHSNHGIGKFFYCCWQESPVP